MSRKLICTLDQLLKLAKKHSVSKYETPIPVSTLLKFRGRAVLVDKGQLSDEIYSRFCELSYELIPNKGEAFRLRLWNWPEQVHHSTLIVYSDSTYDTKDHTELGRLHSGAVWKHFFYCAKRDTFFKMPKEVRL